MAASLPLLSVHQLHSQLASDSARPRATLWLHSLMTSHKALAPVRQGQVWSSPSAP